MYQCNNTHIYTNIRTYMHKQGHTHTRIEGKWGRMIYLLLLRTLLSRGITEKINCDLFYLKAILHFGDKYYFGHSGTQIGHKVKHTHTNRNLQTF